VSLMSVRYKDVDFDVKQTGSGDSLNYFTIPTHETERRGGVVFHNPDAKGLGWALGGTYFVVGVERSNPKTGDLPVSSSTRSVTNYDNYGNIKAESASTDGVDLTQSIQRDFDTDESSWLVSQTKRETACSSTSAVAQQCRTTKLDYVPGTNEIL